MSKNYKKFLLLCLSSFISSTGSGITSFALGVYIYKKTNLASMAGLLLLSGFLLGLILTPVSGILADRYDRRMLMMAGDGLSMIGLLIIAFSIIILDGSSLIIGIVIGVAISSAFSSLIEPAFRSTISDLLQKEEYSKASGLMQLVSSSRYLVSPVLSGLLLNISGILTIIILDFLTILITLPITYIVKKEMN